MFSFGPVSKYIVATRPRISKISMHMSITTKHTKAKKRSHSEQKRKQQDLFKSLSGSDEVKLEEEKAALEKIESDGIASFPPFMHEDLDEVNSVRFRINEMGEKHRARLYEESLPEDIVFSSSDEESDSSEGEGVYSLDDEPREPSVNSSSSVSDPLDSGSNR